MTRRKSTYRSLASLKRDEAVCGACVEAGYPLESLPVIAPGEGQRAYLFGQAPGIVEGEERRPWRGRAGQTLRRWLAMHEDEFYATFYCASVTRCYPGRRAVQVGLVAPESDLSDIPVASLPSKHTRGQSGRGDRTPTPREQELCELWRDWELDLLRPRLIVTVGALALRRMLGLTDLTACVGARFARDGVPVVPLPHPSGASSWPYAPGNRERLDRALGIVRTELARL